jgi:hypothetical protein
MLTLWPVAGSWRVMNFCVLWSWGISWVAEQQLASQEVPYSMELVYEVQYPHVSTTLFLLNSSLEEDWIGWKYFLSKPIPSKKNYWSVLFNLEMSRILSSESFLKEERRFFQKKVFEQILKIINPDCYCIGMWDWTEVKLDLGSNISPCSDRSPLQLGIPFAHIYEHCTACTNCLLFI